MSFIKNIVKKKEWQKCCGSFCDDCEIAFLYKKVYGRKIGKLKLQKDKLDDEK